MASGHRTDVQTVRRPREDSVVHLPPGPRAPVLLQTQQYVRDPFTFLERCQERYAEGGSVTINILGFGQTVWVTDPALIARHRALGLLPDLSSSGTPRGAAANSSNPFPWKETVIGFAATGRCS